MKKTGITSKQLKMLEQEGFLSLSSITDTSKLLIDLEDVNIIWNHTNQFIVIPDLTYKASNRLKALTLKPKSICKLSYFFSKEQINKSRNLRHLLQKGKIKAIKNPELLTEKDLTPIPPLVETLTDGKHSMNSIRESNNLSENIFINELEKYEDKEEALNKAERDKTVKSKKPRKPRKQKAEVEETEETEESDFDIDTVKNL